MARFRGTLQGCRGLASRLGGIKSGLTAGLGGWNIGVKVDCRVNEKGKDEICVYQTGGSNGSSVKKLLKVIKEK